MAVHKRADIQSSFDHLARDEMAVKRTGGKWPFGKLLLVLVTLGVWIGLLALFRELL